MSQTLQAIQTTIADLAARPQIRVPTSMGLTPRAEEDLASRVQYEVEKALRPVLDEVRKGATRPGYIDGEPSAAALTVTADMSEAAQALDRFERRAQNLARSLTLGGLARVALALLPMALVALVLVLMVIPAAEILGVGPISNWVWSSFETTDSNWVKAGIVAAVFAAVAAVLFGIYKAGEVLSAIYRGWR